MTIADPIPANDPLEFYRIGIPSPRAHLSLGKWTGDDGSTSGTFVGLHVAVAHQPKPALFGYYTPTTQTCSELSLGEDQARGFVGLMGRVASGQVFLSAGGGTLVTSDYDAVRLAITGIGTGIGGLMYLGYSLRFWKNARLAPTWDRLEYTLRTGLFAKDLWDAFNPKSGSAGVVTLYGDERVRVAAPFKISLRSGLLADLSAGVSANLQGVVTAGVAAAGIAAVRGTYLAALEGLQVRVRARSLTTVAALKGTVALEGNRVRLGRRRLRSQNGPIARKRGFLDSQMEATRHVFLEAESQLSVAVGEPEKPNGRLAVMPGAVVASAAGAAVAVEQGSASLSSGKAGVRVRPGGVRIGCLDRDADEAYERAVAAAHRARDLEDDAVAAKGEQREALVERVSQSLVGGAAVGSLGSSVVQAGVLQIQNAGDRQAADESTKHRKADAAFTQAFEKARDDRSQALREQLGVDRPVIDVSDRAILLKVGRSAIEITAEGIRIVSAGSNGVSVEASGDVVLNGDSFAAAGGQVQVPGLPPDPPPAPPPAAAPAGGGLLVDALSEEVAQ